MPYIYPYLRVSHRDSAASGISPEVQHEQFKRWFDYEKGAGKLADIEIGRVGWQGGPDLDERGFVRRDNQGMRMRLDKERDDGVFMDLSKSAWKLKFLQRPAAIRLNMVLKPGDFVWFYRIDRCFRNTGDACAMDEQWRARGISMIIHGSNIDTSTAMGRFAMHIFAAAAELDSSLKSERALDIKEGLRQAGQPLNQNKQYGFRCTSPQHNTWVPDEDERRVIRGIIAARHSLPAPAVATWQNVSTAIEAEVALAEGRRPRTRNSTPPLYWTPERCAVAYEQALTAGWATLPPGASMVKRTRRRRRQNGAA
ncbi:MAG: hypothetical protein C0483_18505 [Pirellula sp.]|nr:hypothetical protein [Pirellula sp.]